MKASRVTFKCQLTPAGGQGSTITFWMNEAEFIVKNYSDQERFSFTGAPQVNTDNTLFDLHNSLYQNIIS